MSQPPVWPPPPPPLVAPQPTEPTRPQRSPLLGKLSLLLVSLSAAAATISMVPVARVMADLMRSEHTIQPDSNLLAQAVLASASGWMAVFQVATVVGIVFMIAGLVAAITRRGRTTGIIAFVVGLLAPVCWMAAMMVVLYPVMTSLVG